MKKIALLIIPAFLVGCGNACDKAGDTITAKYESCGVEVAEGDGDGESVDCTDELAASSECTAACIDAADCGVIDMSDTDMAGENWTSYTECLTACAA